MTGSKRRLFPRHNDTNKQSNCFRTVGQSFYTPSATQNVINSFTYYVSVKVEACTMGAPQDEQVFSI